MNYTEKKLSLDAFISMILIKKLLTPINKTKAYKLDLINASGDIIKSPETKEEKESLTLLDKLIFKIKKLLGTRISDFSKYSYLKTINDPHMYNNVSINRDYTSVSQIAQLKKDMMKVLKENNIPVDTFVSFMINDDVDQYIKKEIL